MKMNQVELLAKLFRSLANKKRLHIVKALHSQRETIGQVSDFTGLPYKTVERHLKILSGSGIVKQHRNGIFTEFHLNSDHESTSDDTNHYNDILIKMVITPR